MSRYQEAGVDIHAGYELVNKIKKDVKSTQRMGTTGNIGSFGGTFDLSVLNVKEPVLVSGTDGVGTKLLIAQKMDKHDTIGIDCVAMCVNDILAQGAEPLYFLDYIATGKNDPDKIAQIVAGVTEGCRQAGTALIGGETAEMPDMYAKDEYDLAGFSSGVVEKSKLLTDANPQENDILVGLASSGIHSNGFSLVRQILFKDNKIDLFEKRGEFGGKTIGEVILEPTKIYIDSVLPLVKENLVNGIAHITGGGLIENLPRMFADDLTAEIYASSWKVLPIFEYLKKLGNLSQDDCYETFNMGIGMVLAVSEDKLESVKKLLSDKNEDFYIIGNLRKRKGNEEKIIVH